MESAKTFLKEKVFYLIGGAILATSGWYNAKILVQEKFNELKKQGFDYAIQRLAETAQKSGKVSISFPDTQGNVQTLSLIVEIKQDSQK